MHETLHRRRRRCRGRRDRRLGRSSGATTNPSLLAKEMAIPARSCGGSASWSVARSPPRSLRESGSAQRPCAARAPRAKPVKMTMSVVGLTLGKAIKAMRPAIASAATSAATCDGRPASARTRRSRRTGPHAGRRRRRTQRRANNDRLHESGVIYHPLGSRAYTLPRRPN